MAAGHHGLANRDSLPGEQVQVTLVLDRPPRVSELTIDEHPRALFGGQSVIPRGCVHSGRQASRRRSPAQRDRAIEQTATRPAPDTRYRAGVGVTALIALFLAFDSIIHILEIDASVESFAELGYPEGSAVAIGVLELACLALYVIPRTAVLGTAVLGAVLLTGYLGGAVSAHVRIESPLSSTTLFPVYVGVAVWVGLYLRDPRLRTLLAG